MNSGGKQDDSVDQHARKQSSEKYPSQGYSQSGARNRQKEGSTSNSVSGTQSEQNLRTKASNSTTT